MCIGRGTRVRAGCWRSSRAGTSAGRSWSTLIAAIIAGLLGAVAFGVAIWRSGTLPKWSGVLFALGFVLLVGSAPIVSQLGGILLLVGGGWIARTIGQAGATSARTAPTVSPL